MGLLDTLSKKLQASTTKLAMDRAKDVPNMVMNLKQCRDEDLKEEIVRQLRAIMQALKNTAASGRPESRQAMNYYELYKRQFESVFEEYEIG